MRKLPVILAVLIGALVATAAATSSARTSPESPAIVCPLLRGEVVPCCGPPVAATGRAVPQAGAAACCAEQPAGCCPVTPAPADVATFCCPPTAICAEPSPTIAVAPSPIVAGAPVTVSGVLAGGGGAAVTLRQAPSGGGFQQVASTTADTGGAYRFALPAGAVLTNTSWYVSSGDRRSATVAESVSARVAIAPGPVSFGVGSRIAISGRVVPSHAGQRALLLLRTARAWKVVAGARLNAASRFVLRLGSARGGTLRLRVELPGDARNVRSFSRLLTLTVARRA